MAGSSPRQDALRRHERFTPWITSSSTPPLNAPTRPVWQIIQQLPGKLILRLPSPPKAAARTERSECGRNSDLAGLLHGEVAGHEVAGAEPAHHRLLGDTAG